MQLPSSPEMVVLFLPAEAIFMAALERDVVADRLRRQAQNVFIASPLTLIALLQGREHRLAPGAH